MKPIFFVYALASLCAIRGFAAFAPACDPLFEVILITENTDRSPVISARSREAQALIQQRLPLIAKGADSLDSLTDAVFNELYDNGSLFAMDQKRSQHLTRLYLFQAIRSFNHQMLEENFDRRHSHRPRKPFVLTLDLEALPWWKRTIIVRTLHYALKRKSLQVVAAYHAHWLTLSMTPLHLAAAEDGIERLIEFEPWSWSLNPIQARQDLRKQIETEQQRYPFYDHTGTIARPDWIDEMPPHPLLSLTQF